MSYKDHNILGGVDDELELMEFVEVDGVEGGLTI